MKSVAYSIFNQTQTFQYILMTYLQSDGGFQLSGLKFSYKIWGYIVEISQVLMWRARQLQMVV